MFSGRLFERGNETSGSMMGDKFVGNLNPYQLLKKPPPLSRAIDFK
jgi:hypothetical protein